MRLRNAWARLISVAGVAGAMGCTGAAEPTAGYGVGAGAEGASAQGSGSGGAAGPAGGVTTTSGATGVGGATTGGVQGASTTGAAGTVNLPEKPTAAGVRRLTHVEYNNTVADLLHDTSAPADQFTADIAQNGFTNNAAALTVSPALVEQYMSAAEDLGRPATADLVGLLGCDPASAGEQACAEAFIRDFGQRAWRRPISEAERTRLLGVFTTARAEFELDVAVQLLIQVVLQSPQFIYMLEPAAPGTAPGSVEPLDAWQLATRLSYFLLGSMPDESLMAAAEAGALSTPEQVAA